jgi:hypothetical protein
MKSLSVKLGVIFIVIGLSVFPYAEARGGECAWVLWESSSFTAKEAKNNSHVDWYIVGAFPTANACWQTEEDICMRRRELASENRPNQDPLFKPQNVECSKSWGGHMQTWNNERGFWMSQWKCLPDTIDPKK